MNATDEQASYAQSEVIHDRYKARIEAALESHAKLFREAGWEAGEVIDLTGDEFEYAILVGPKGTNLKESPHSISIEFEISESAVYGDKPGGVSFRIDVTGRGGWVIGGLAPYNYTDECWVPMFDDDAVEERFSIVENCDFTELFNLCAKWVPPTNP